jgi:hypothetical protein
MPDTGAPWNLPFPAPSALVRDAPVQFEDLAEAVADGLTTVNVGIGTNVVQTVKTDTFSTTSSSYVDITGLTVDITPTSATSKILIIGMVTHSATNARGVMISVTRGDTDLMVGNAAGSRVRSTVGSRHSTPGDDETWSSSIVFLDSPNVATATTYKLRIRVGNPGTAYVNRSQTDSDANTFQRTASSITVIEVAA